MKKTTITKEQKDTFRITKIIDDVALIHSSISGRSGLLNIETNELIGNLDYYSTEVNPSFKKFIQTKARHNTINYYDVTKHEYTFYDFELVKTLDKVFLLKSKVNNKTYLFDEETYKDSTSVFNIEVEDANYLLYNTWYYSKEYLKLSLNGKQAIYKTGSGLITAFEFDDIEVYRYVTFFRKDNKYQFRYNDEFSFISPEFNRIEVDKNDKDILYCYSDTNTYVYDLENRLLVLKTAKEVEHVKKFYYNDNSKEYLFIAKENDEKEILSSVVNIKSKEINVKTLISGYDEISFDYKIKDYMEVFYIDKNENKGLFCGDARINNILIPNYTDVEHLWGDFYILTSKAGSDIVRFGPNIPLETIIESCSLIDKTDKAIIYSKKSISEKEKYGLFFPRDGYNASVVPATSTSIKVLSQCFYETEENDKKGIYYLEKLIIPKEYKNIKISFSSKYGRLDNAKRVYFSLEKEKSCLLARRTCSDFEDLDKNNKLETLGKYNDISFLEDIIACRTLDSTYIYDYNNILLGEFSPNAFIAPVEPKIDSWNRHLYSIDGIYYYYENNKLIKPYQNVINSYITTYETDTDVFEVSTYDKKALDEFSNYIDSMEDNLGEEALMKYSSDNSSLKEKYPSLVLKNKKRNN